MNELLQVVMLEADEMEVRKERHKSDLPGLTPSENWRAFQMGTALPLRSDMDLEGGQESLLYALRIWPRQAADVRLIHGGPPLHPNRRSCSPVPHTRVGGRHRRQSAVSRT